MLTVVSEGGESLSSLGVSASIVETDRQTAAVSEPAAETSEHLTAKSAGNC